MRNLILPLAVLALAFAPVAAAQTAPNPRDADEETRDTAAPSDPATETDTDAEDTEAPDGSNALQSGGSSNNTAPRRSSLQQALLACEGLSGSASARCQEQALADHPGEH